MNPKHRILQLYDEFILAETEIEKETLRTHIKSIATTYSEKDAICYHILGLIDYESENWKETIHNSIANFKKSIALDADNFLAQLYLAHCYHNLEAFIQALDNYRKVDQQKLQEFQVWRYVKLLEQIGHCEYKLGNKKIGEFYFSQVLEWYKELPEIDRAIPSELMDCLPKDHWIVTEMKKIITYLE
ncbi:MAG: hypothetical protein AAF617_09365 [Bacteroidota bacterium]